MNAEVIDPDHQWKSAAAQEGVDYDAVQKSFMDQSYGVVANKAKILFQDPFRLGFEIVHRNEKATKMVGIFAFRVNTDLLYAPTFFVNGEIKAADMLYRADVKRFVPLTEDWCAYLARGVNESAGNPVDKNRSRQPDAHMDRLAYPQRVKYASESEFVEAHMAMSKAELVETLEKSAGKMDTVKQILKYLGVGGAGAAIGGTGGYLSGHGSGVAEGSKVGRDEAMRNLLSGVYAKMQELGEAGREQQLPETMLSPKSASDYMDRLASPQRVKYASAMDFAMIKAACDERLVGAVGEDGYDLEKVAADSPGLDLLIGMGDSWEAEMTEARDAFVKAAKDGSLWTDMMAHCADNTPLRKLLPEAINQHGPEALEKLASLMDGSSAAEAYLVENYSKEELETVDAWMAKEAAAEDPEAGNIVINLDPSMAKSAAARNEIFDRGYELIDKRPADSLNTVIEEIGDGTVKELSSPGAADVLLDSGSLERAFLFRRDSSLLHIPMSDTPNTSKVECVYFPKSKELCSLTYNQPVFGDDLFDREAGMDDCDANALRDGKVYVMVSKETLTVSPPFMVEGKEKDGESTQINIRTEWGGGSKLIYAPDRQEAQGQYISDESCFLEVDCDVERGDEGGPDSPAAVRRLEPVCTQVLMNSAGVDKWIRTAGGITTSNEVSVSANSNGTFDVRHSIEGTLLKEARDLGMLEAHLSIAEDFSLTLDKAGELLDKAVDGDVSYRVFDTMSKSGYMTRSADMENWVESYDPELQVKLDAPQRQVLSTYTPQRKEQSGRYGDTHQRVPAENSDHGEELLPMDAVLSKSPEELAQLSQQYDMPHIFDHGVMGQLATNSYNIVDQIRQYIPDLESGVDRYFRILFLLRYRPADFEESYGKDALIELEGSLAELSARAGENLLRMLQRFDANQYSAQDN